MNSSTILAKTAAISAPKMSVVSTILASDVIGKTIMLMLIFASIWTWAIILYKHYHLNKVNKKMISFEQTFWSSQLIEQLYDKISKNVDNLISAVLVAALNEYRRERHVDKNNLLLNLGLKDRILHSMHFVRNRELEKLESNIVILAIIGSASPFVGLLGTVWGIMHSFQSIAVTKNTGLAVVAPGIAEALLATAIGLFAAIPAVIFYNLLTTKLSLIENKIDSFISEFYTILSRIIDEEKA